MKNKTVTLSGVFCVLIGNTRTISTVRDIKPSPYTPDLAAQRRYRRVWSIIVSMWTVKKSPPSVKAQTTHKVEIARLLSDSLITPYDRMVTCHAVIFVFLRCHHALWRRSAAFKGLPRCRSPPYPPKIWNPAHHQILEVLLCTIAHYISFSQKTFLTLTPHVQVTAYHLLQRAMKVGWTYDPDRTPTETTVGQAPAHSQYASKTLLRHGFGRMDCLRDRDAGRGW